MWFGTGVEKGVWCARPTRFSIRNVLISFWYHYSYFSFTQLCFPQTKSFTVFLEATYFQFTSGPFCPVLAVPDHIHDNSGLF